MVSVFGVVGVVGSVDVVEFVMVVMFLLVVSVPLLLTPYIALLNCFSKSVMMAGFGLFSHYEYMLQ